VAGQQIAQLRAGGAAALTAMQPQLHPLSVDAAAAVVAALAALAEQ
jgi:hypothetical protein